MKKLISSVVGSSQRNKTQIQPTKTQEIWYTHLPSEKELLLIQLNDVIITCDSLTSVTQTLAAARGIKKDDKNTLGKEVLWKLN